MRKERQRPATSSFTDPEYTGPARRWPKPKNVDPNEFTKLYKNKSVDSDNLSKARLMVNNKAELLADSLNAAGVPMEEVMYRLAPQMPNRMPGGLNTNGLVQQAFELDQIRKLALEQALNRPRPNEDGSFDYPAFYDDGSPMDMY